MTPIDFLLLAGAVLTGGYVFARLFVGWLRSSAHDPGAKRDIDHRARLALEPKLERVERTNAPWHHHK